MATPPTLPAGSTAALQNRFNNLANDDERRGFLAYWPVGSLGLSGANVIRYGWNKLSAEEQQNYIDEALQADEDQNVEFRNPFVLTDSEDAQESEDIGTQQQGEDSEGLPQLEDYDDEQQVEDNESLPQVDENRSLTPLEDYDSQMWNGEEGVPIGQLAERVESSAVKSRKRKQQSDDLSLQSEHQGTTNYKPSRGTVENTSEAWAEFVQNHPEQVEALGIHPDWEWVWATTIAARGNDYHKTVMVWVALDENNRVRERLVEKKTQVQKDYTLPQEKEQLVLKMMNFCDNTVRGYWNHVAPDDPDENANTYTMFMEFCEHGDLNELLAFYSQEHLRDNQIPETFIWLVFFSLAEAIYALNTGMCGAKIGQRQPDETCLASDGTLVYYDEQDPPYADGETRPDWNPWAHLDIKPMNIFLGKSAADSKCSAYPRVILADCDLADEHSNFGVIARAMGTRGYRPPELKHPKKFGRLNDESSDIYSTGLTVWSLMNAALGLDNDLIRIANEKAALRFAKGDTFPSTRLPDSAAMYSQNLHELVKDCLKLQPRSRIGFVELRQRAAAGLEKSIEMWGTTTKDDYEQRWPLLGIKEASRFRLGGEWDRKRRRVMDSEDSGGSE